MAFAPKQRNRARTGGGGGRRKTPPHRSPPPPPTAPLPTTTTVTTPTWSELFGISSPSETIPLKHGLSPYIVQGYLQALSQHKQQVGDNSAGNSAVSPVLTRQCKEINNINIDYTNKEEGGKFLQYQVTDYAPKCFAHVRSLSNISEKQHLQSIKLIQGSGKEGEGKSGMLFFTTEDQQYILKTLKSDELPVMLNFLPHYLAHLNNFKCSLLPRFYGLTTFTFPKRLVGGTQQSQTKYILVVMENVLRPKQLHSGWFSRQPKVHEVYDLKGSTKGRVVRKKKSEFRKQTSGEQKIVSLKNNSKAAKETARSTRASTAVESSIVLKDLDCQRRLVMDPKRRDRFFTQLRDDVHLLITHNLMDYSLLMGVSFHGGSDAFRRASTDILSRTSTISSNSSNSNSSSVGSSLKSTKSEESVLVEQNDLETVGSTGIPLHAVLNRVYGATNSRMDELLPTDSGGKYTLKCSFVGRSIVKERGQSPYITYHIELIKETTIEGRWTNSIDTKKWTVYRRYSDFVRLRSTLNSELSVSGYSTVVSPLPPKVLFGNFDSAFLDKRQKKLNDWCNMLLNVFTSRIVQTSLPLKIFLTRQADEPPLGMSRRKGGRNEVKKIDNPAAMRSMRVSRATDVDSGSRVTLFLGIIDILQCFNFKKRMEASIKGRLSHPLAVSATDAQSYGKRFVEYLSTVLPAK